MARQKIVHSPSMVAHLWANQSQYHARNAGETFYFRDSTIYSYGGHFPIARHVKNAAGESAVLFTDRNYSSTTNRHKSEVRQAIKAGTKIFYVERPDRNYEGAPVWIKDELRHKAEKVLELATKAKRARTNGEYLIRQAESLVSQANEFAAFFGSEERIGLPSDTDVAAIIAAQRKETTEATKRKL
jgi:hypothetical protein